MWKRCRLLKNVATEKRVNLKWVPEWDFITALIIFLGFGLPSELADVPSRHISGWKADFHSYCSCVSSSSVVLGFCSKLQIHFIIPLQTGSNASNAFLLTIHLSPSAPLPSCSAFVLLQMCNGQCACCGPDQPGQSQDADIKASFVTQSSTYSFFLCGVNNCI